jgi:hypothetical protein
MGRKKIYGDHKIIFRLDDKLYDEVLELLDRVNSGENKLTISDLSRKLLENFVDKNRNKLTKK